MFKNKLTIEQVKKSKHYLPPRTTAILSWAECLMYDIPQFGKLLMVSSMIMYKSVTTIPTGSTAKWLEARDFLLGR